MNFFYEKVAQLGENTCLLAARRAAMAKNKK
jgi:hypothetical protein